MKKIKFPNRQLGLLYLLCVLLFACKKKDETVQPPEEIVEPDTTISVYQPNQFLEGYTLISPIFSNNAYLLDMQGRIVKTWETPYKPASVCYLLEDGRLLRTANLNNNAFDVGGAGGRVEIYDFDGNLTWEWEYSDDTHCLHHDIKMMPNGNILMVAWEKRYQEEVIQAGKNPDNLDRSQEMWMAQILEVEPVGRTGGNIVWQWDLWHHLIQDFDPSKDNFGDVAAHPEQHDFNYPLTIADYAHINAVEYIPEFDLIAISVRNMHEVWFLDHSTTTAQAASNRGGNYGQGGGILYRWGNPLAHRAGTAADQVLFGQHAPTWLGTAPSKGGNMLIFSNGSDASRAFSTVEEVQIPLDAEGNFSAIDAPAPVQWRFQDADLFSPILSNAQRLPNGNTLICEGREGIVYELNPQDEVVWQYHTPLPTPFVFRAYRFPKDFPAFQNRDLQPTGEVME